MKKSVLCLLLSVVMVFTLLPFSSFAEEIVANGTCGSKGDNLTWTLDEAGVLTISGTGKMYNYCGEDDTPPWNAIPSWDVPDITKIVIDNGVTSIGDVAFAYCNYLENITIPNSVKSIGERAFEFCEKLANITLPNSINSVGKRAFEYCEGLEAITIPENVSYINEGTFEGCSSLEKAVLPESLKSIGNNAFDNCISLKSITIPKSVTSIGDQAFNRCASLKSITIPNSVKNIGELAFTDCTSLESLKISSSVKIIREGVFCGCESLKSITIPNGVTSIGDSAFSGCASIKSVKIPNSVTTLDEGAFYGCSALEEITIPYSVKSIGEYALYGCDNLKHINYLEALENWHKVDFDYICKEKILSAAMHIDGHTFKKGVCTRCGEKNPFADIKNSDYCFDPIIWAYNHSPQITNGVDDTHFASNKACTRGQIVTFLWRAFGAPTVKGVKNPFKDIKSSDYYYKAVLWAVSEGITDGVDEKHFAPNDSCTRGQAVTFLWRANDLPLVYCRCTFKDVSVTAYYYDAMLWAVDNGITTGVSKLHFAPNDTCTRGQIVTFLYRNMA